MRPLNKHSKLFPGRKRSSEGKEIHPAPPETFIKAKSTVRDNLLHPGNEEIELRLRLVRLENIINENIEEFLRKTEEIEHSRLKICRC